MTKEDHDHLRILSILNYVWGVLNLGGVLFPLIYVAMGLFMALNPEAFHNGQGASEPPPPWLGWIFVGIGGTLSVLFGLLTCACLANGRFLARRKHYMFCFVVACLQCLQMPIGTALGAFTLIVLSRQTVKLGFQETVPEAEVIR
ncbi:MAG: hypothetical protein U0935_11075 [Pirellulales bacterium]